MTIRCAHGDTASYPLAVVKINIGGKDIIMTASVSGTLPASVLLGWNIPELMDFVANGQPTHNQPDALAVMTHLQRRQQQGSLDPEHTEPEAQLNGLPIRRPIICLILMILSLPLQVRRNPLSLTHRNVRTAVSTDTLLRQQVAASQTPST